MMNKKSERFTVATTKEIKQKIEELSQKEDRTSSCIIHKALEEYFKSREEQHRAE